MRTQRNSSIYPQAYYQYLAVYHGLRDYFACHDIMEEQWKQDAHSRYTGSWLLLVRIAVACYHARRGNWAGARKMMAKAAQEANAKILTELGLDGEQLVADLRHISASWNQTERPVYRDLPLPIADPLLLTESKRICRENGWTWNSPLEDVPYDIIHRHLTRDRSAVIEARRQAAEQKRLAGKGRPVP